MIPRTTPYVRSISGTRAQQLLCQTLLCSALLVTSSACGSLFYDQPDRFNTVDGPRRVPTLNQATSSAQPAQGSEIITPPAPVHSGNNQNTPMSAILPSTANPTATTQRRIPEGNITLLHSRLLDDELHKSLDNTVDVALNDVDYSNTVALMEEIPTLQARNTAKNATVASNPHTDAPTNQVASNTAPQARTTLSSIQHLPLVSDEEIEAMFTAIPVQSAPTAIAIAKTPKAQMRDEWSSITVAHKPEHAHTQHATTTTTKTTTITPTKPQKLATTLSDEEWKQIPAGAAFDSPEYQQAFTQAINEKSTLSVAQAQPQSLAYPTSIL